MTWWLHLMNHVHTKIYMYSLKYIHTHTHEYIHTFVRIYVHKSLDVGVYDLVIYLHPMKYVHNQNTYVNTYVRKSNDIGVYDLMIYLHCDEPYTHCEYVHTHVCVCTHKCVCMRLTRRYAYFHLYTWFGDLFTFDELCTH